MPARLLDEAIHHAQAETRALPFGLGREERLEHALAHFGRHAGARIGDGDHHVLAGRHVGVALRVGIVERGIARFDREPAVAVHRVAGVDREIQQRVLHLERIDERIPQAARHDRLDLDAVAERAAEHVVEAAHEAAEIHDLRRERLTAAEREQLRSEIGAARDARQRVAHALFRLLRPGDVLGEQLQVPADHLQQVVEIMRDTTRQFADRLHFLRHAQRFLGMTQRFGRLAIGRDIATDAVNALRRRIDREGPRNPAPRVVDAPQTAFVAHWRAARAQPVQMFGDGGVFVGVDEIEVRAREQPLGVMAEQPRPRRAHALQPAVEAGHDEQILAQFPQPVAIGDGFDHAPLERFVQVAQRALRLRALGDLGLRGLIEPRVVDGDRGLRRDAGEDAFGALGEHARLRVTEEEAAEHFAVARQHRRGEIAAHREMPLRHAAMRRVVAVARVLRDVVGADDAVAFEGRARTRPCCAASGTCRTRPSARRRACTACSCRPRRRARCRRTSRTRRP